MMYYENIKKNTETVETVKYLYLYINQQLIRLNRKDQLVVNDTEKFSITILIIAGFVDNCLHKKNLNYK